MLEWLVIPSSSGQWNFSTVTRLSLVALDDMAQSFIQLHKPLHHKAVIHDGGIGMGILSQYSCCLKKEDYKRKH